MSQSADVRFRPRTCMGSTYQNHSENMVSPDGYCATHRQCILTLFIIFSPHFINI
jgi:hypothetical protein